MLFLVLQIFVLKQEKYLDALLLALFDAGITDSTVVDCKDLMQTIAHETAEPPPIFGSLRHFLNPLYNNRKMIFTVMKEEQAVTARKVINEIVGDIEKLDIGLLLTVPLLNVEGLKG